MMRSIYKKLLLTWMLCLPFFLSGQVLTGEIISINQPSCLPPFIGSIEVGGLNGSPPYTYTLDASIVQSIGIFNDLDLGEHSIVINDEVGDTFTINFSIEIINQLVASVFDLTHVACFGNTDGFISVVASSGTSPFQYSIDNGVSFQSTGNFTDLPNGLYQIIVNDAAGCADTVNAEVLALSQINILALNQQHIDCHGAASGSVEVVGELGTSPYQYSIDGVNYQIDQLFTGIPAGDYQFWVEDDNGCKDSLSLSFTEPDPIEMSNFLIGDINCFGGSSGSVSFISSGGVAPYSYEINHAISSNTPLFENLEAGQYVITSSDNNGCELDSIVTIIEPDSIIITIDSTQSPSCFGYDDGAIHFSASGGIPPYDYKYVGTSWQNNGNFTGLSSGSYSLKARDSNGCVRTIEYFLAEPSAINLIDIYITDVYCNISTNGSIEMAANGGTSPYEYSMNGSPNQTSPLFSNLSSGSYSCFVEDANGCIDNVSVDIIETIDLQIDNVNIIPANCGVSSTGELTINVSGGFSPYTYSMDGSPAQSSSNFTNVSVGSHDILVTAADGCFISSTVYLPEVSPIDIYIIDLVNPVCEGNYTGSVEMGANGGTAPYSYSVDFGMNWQTSQLFTGLTDSTYIFSVQDQNGCVADTIITLEEQNQLEMGVITASTNICPGSNDGMIEIQGQNGVAPYTYSTDGNSFSSNSVFTNLDAGDFELWLQDAIGCIVDSIFTIESFESPSINVDSLVSPTCNGDNDGVIAISATGSALPYEYSFEGGPFATNSYFTGLIAADYSIVVRDANTCENTVDLTLSEYPVLLVNIDSIQHVKCKNEETGAIYYSIDGGLSPYLYRINNGSWTATSSDISGLFAGSYNLDFIDDNGCIQSFNVTIDEPLNELDAQLLSITDVTCLSDSNGNVVGEAIGGVGPYTYSLDSVSFQSSSSFNGLTTGAYTYYVIDNNNCEASEDFAINALSPISLAWASVNPPSCETVTNGSLSVGVLSGTYPFSFQLNAGPFQAGGTFSGLSEDYYTINVVDDLGCTASIDTVLYSEQTLQLSVDSVQNIICVADSSGQVWLSAEGGTPGYSYYIEGELISGSSQVGLTNGVYQTWVVDAIGCSDSIEFAVLQESLLQGSIFAQQNILCNNGSLGSVTVNGTTGSSPYTYSIDGVNFDTVNTFNNLEEGLYTIIVHDATDCQAEVEVNIELLTQIDLQMQYSTPPTCNGIANASAAFNVINGIGPYMYSMDNEALTDQSIFNDLSAGIHSVFATDSQGCNDSLEFTILDPEPIGIIIDSLGAASCFGMSDAFISVSSENAVGNVLYSIFPDGSSNLLGLFEGLGDGDYLVSLVDQNLCTVDSIITITTPNSLDVTVNEVNPIDCYGDANAIVQMSVSGGTAPFTYLIDSIDYGNNPYINNLSAGNHDFVIMDINDCEVEGEFSLTQPDSIYLQFFTFNDVSCYGLDNGTAFFIANGGNGEFNFELNSSIYSANGSFSNLEPNEYTLTVFDSLMCSYEFDFLISEPDTLVIDSVLFQNPVCYGDTNGSFTVLASGGTPDYNYFVPGIGTSSDSLFQNLEGGAYYISVSDNNGCNNSTIVILDEPDEFTLQTLAVVPPLCYGDSTGTVLVQANGGSGTPMFGLSWDLLDYSSVFYDLPTGNIQIYAMDSLGCSDSTIAFIPVTDSLVFGAISQSASCYGLNDGAVAFNPSGNSDDFMFSLDEINWVDTSVFSNLLGGEYVFFMLDEFGCTKDTVITVTQPDSLYISSLSVYPVSCSDENSGVISIEVSGGTSPYESTLGTNVQIGNMVNFENLAIGNYQIITTDSNECVFVLDTSLFQVDSVYASVDDLVLNCYGDTNGVATVDYSGGSGDYYFEWNNTTEDTTETTQPNLEANVTYSVVVTDVLDSNCNAIAYVTPTEPPIIEFELYPYSPSCDPEDIWVNIELLNGGVEPFLFAVNEEEPVESGVFSDLSSISTRFKVIDASGCSEEQWLVPENPNLLHAYFEVSDNVVSMAEGEVTFIDLGENSSYLKWDFGNDISVEGNIGDPAIAASTSGVMEQPLHNYTQAGEFIAKLTAASDFGCEDEYERSIIVEEDHRVFVPNSFTPDGDGVNDVFLVQGSTIENENFRLSIFDRSGTLVWQSFDINIGWDGLSMNGNSLRPEVYVFMLSYYSGGRLFEKNGTVTLVR